MTHAYERDKDIVYLNTLPLDEARQFIARERVKQAAWKFLLDFQPGQRCLVLEGGVGSASIALSEHYQEIVLLQNNPSTPCLTQGWTNNITVVCSSFFAALPFTESTFDCVILHDIGTLFAGRNETEATLLQSLLEAKRVLKSEGTLVVTGDNKSLFLWLRSKLKYLKAPADEKKRLRGLPPPVTGLSHVDTMIRDMGFQHRSLFSMTPRLIPFQEVSRIGAGRAVQKWMRPAFMIIATQKSAPDSFLNRFSKIVLSHLGDVEIIRYISGNPDSVILIVRAEQRSGVERSAIVRLPLTKTSATRCQRGVDALQTLSGRRTVLSGLVPSVLGHGVFCDQPYFIESLIPGRVIASPQPAALGRVVREAASLLTLFHQETAQPCFIDRTVFSRISSPFISTILPHIKGSDAQKSFGYIMDVMRERWLGVTLPLVFSHGDFQADNMILNPDTLRIQGVIDWDLSNDPALPLLDLLYLFLYAETMLGRGHFEDIFMRQFFPLRLDNGTMTVIDNYCRAIGISSDDILPLLIFFWLHHVAFRLERVWRQLDRWMDQSFYPILLKVYETVRGEKAA